MAILCSIVNFRPVTRNRPEESSISFHKHEIMCLASNVAELCSQFCFVVS